MQSGTTTTTASAGRDRGGVSVVALSAPEPTTWSRRSARSRSPGNGGTAAGLNGRPPGVDVHADDAVTPAGELNRQRQPDLAETDDGDLHGGSRTLIFGLLRESRRASAMRTVASPSPIVTRYAASPRTAATNLDELGQQRLRLGDGIAGDVTLGDPRNAAT